MKPSTRAATAYANARMNSRITGFLLILGSVGVGLGMDLTLTDTPHPPVLDGHLNDSTWRTASTITLNGVRVQGLCDPTFAYFSVALSLPPDVPRSPSPARRRDDPLIAQFPSLEWIFNAPIKTDASTIRYTYLLFAPSGGLLDFTQDWRPPQPPAERNSSWNAPIQEGRRLEENRWTLEFNVPLTTLELDSATSSRPFHVRLAIPGDPAPVKFEWSYLRLKPGSVSEPPVTSSFEFVPATASNEEKRLMLQRVFDDIKRLAEELNPGGSSGKTRFEQYGHVRGLLLGMFGSKMDILWKNESALDETEKQFLAGLPVFFEKPELAIGIIGVPGLVFASENKKDFFSRLRSQYGPEGLTLLRTYMPWFMKGIEETSPEELWVRERDNMIGAYFYHTTQKLPPVSQSPDPPPPFTGSGTAVLAPVDAALADYKKETGQYPKSLQILVDKKLLPPQALENVTYENDLINDRYLLRVAPRTGGPWLGVRVKSARLQENTGTRNYLEITYVDPDSPASRVGLLIGDGIYSLEKEPVGSPVELMKVLSRYAPGSTILLEGSRKSRPLKMSVVLASKP